MKKYFVSFLLLLFFLPSGAFAQTGWVRSTVFQNAGRNSSLGLDSNGNPIIAFRHRDFTPGTIGTVGYIKKIGGNFADPLWSDFFEVAETSDPGERIGLAMRVGVTPFLLFRSGWVGIDNILGLAWPVRDVWPSPDGLSGGLFFFPESVGTPWFDLDFGRGGAQVIFKAGSEGFRPGFDTGYPLTCFTEDADASNDQDVREGQLVHFWSDPGRGWKCRTVGLGSVAGPEALSIDQEGIAHIIASYNFNADGAPTRSPGAFYYRSNLRTAGNYSWLEGDGAVASKPLYFSGNFDPSQMFLSIDTDDAADPNSRAHICAYIPDQKKLVYIHYNAVSDMLLVENVDTTAGNDVGKYCDIAVDRARDILHISYFDDTHKRLKYATKPIGGTSWTISNVDAGNVGQYSSIAVDAEGFVHISYYNSTTDALKYATNHPGCGNEILEAGEACDDGNRINRDGCSDGCLMEGNLNADLGVTISAQPQTMLDNETVTYTVNVVNNGPEIAPAAFLTINLAPGEVVQPRRGCTLIGSPPETMRCGPSPLTPGRSDSLQFSSPSRTAGTRAVVAQIGGNGIIDPNPNNNQAAVNLTINPSVSSGGPDTNGGAAQGMGGNAGQGAGSIEGGGGGGEMEPSGGGCQLIIRK